MMTITPRRSNPLQTAWGYALIIIPLGSLWWVVLRVFFMVRFEIALVALVVPIALVTWLVTPSPVLRRTAKERLAEQGKPPEHEDVR
jgi:hypothetical protein